MAFFPIVAQDNLGSGNLHSELTGSFGNAIAFFFNKVDKFDSFLG